MNVEEILSHIDHTVLGACATWADIDKLAKEAMAYKVASICIPSSYVARVHEAYPEVNICTVVGFPLGNSTTATKVAETEQALADGAGEIDMVIHLGAVKSGDYASVTEEIATLKKIVGDKILKVIIETCYLTEEEKIALCKCVTEAKADFIKTSTGFGTGGATIEDIKLFKEHIGQDVKMKAAGGISTLEDMEHYLALGCERLGTSRAIKLLQDKGLLQ